MLFIWENFLRDQLDLIFIYTADNKVTIVQFGSEITPMTHCLGVNLVKFRVTNALY